MRQWLKIPLILLLFAAVAGCGTVDDAGAPQGDSPAAAGGNKEGTLAKAQEQGYVTVGFANEKPYAYQTADGELTGEAVEIARTVLKNLGINEMRGELTEFGSLVAGLQAKRFDLITAGMFINPDRCSAVAFADPEYSIGEAIAVKKGNPLVLHSYKDIAENKDAKVAVMAGAVELGYLEASGVPKERMLIVPDQASAISALQAGRAEAITMTGPALQSMLDMANDSNLERVADFEQPTVDGKSVRGYGATAFRLDDQAFKDAFNTELKKLKDSGKLLTILQKFRFTEDELPGDMTAAELCGG
ncbi:MULTISPECIES: ectoine/hydroxyectoine ABC transporter substrate-binding protein EhuB [unclassified Paenibacillus]|uniref:ectoine/hydroxyectoine ABC transporter substrate-binding protein EhuB n=1 Tax=unclassified Paenibacillus TaxID=185978 RepID=UPI001B695CAE|nr:MULTISPECIES: ectoine/hydroxyectoine ABC transporter substrate-binding protein EhuB [unclassified Paenibacillus]MBP1157240.1 polar amino acid transport system substrate-binding protein [Paenibacillus sp. PvP091]MBP1172021.1 polar amino acid transport system substrate-binding protein [Paenibacillus sp. PvR098]MBP2438402.1 polar amino acid transport system substrate-binding protein [Paenibacillus sp. PvP052]